jgi:hypothetical protein
MTMDRYPPGYHIGFTDMYGYGAFGTSRHFTSGAEAVAVAKELLEQHLHREFAPGMTPEELYEKVMGDKIEILVSAINGAPRMTFSGKEYVRARCEEMCAAAQSQQTPALAPREVVTAATMMPDLVGDSVGLQLLPVIDGDRQVVGDIWVAKDRDGPFMGRSRFINSFQKRLTEDEAEDVMWAALAEEWADIDRIDGEALPWYCRECGCNYAEEAWKIFPRFEEEHLDSYRGRCPEGHERMIAD